MKKFFIITLFFSVLAFLGYWYVFKNDRNFSSEKSIKVTNVLNIITEFNKNEIAANAKYLDKMIEFSGSVSLVDLKNKTMMLEEKVFTSFKPEDFVVVKENTIIKIKGRFLGYDELLEEIKLDNCMILK